MTDSYLTTTLPTLLRESQDENRILRQRLDKVLAENHQLGEEVLALRHKLWDLERDETEELGTFPAPPRSKLGVTG